MSRRLRTAVIISAVAVLAVAAARAAGVSPQILIASSEPALVSIPGHRTTEWSAAADPSNPLHLVAGGIDWDSGTGTWACAAFVSWDGGRTWSGSVIAPGGDYDAHGDPWVAIGPDGTAHYTCLNLQIRENGGGRLLYARSADGGATWSAPVTLAPRAPQHSVDRTGVVAGPDGTVVACLNEYDFENPGAPAIFDGLAIVASGDGGITWETSRQLTTTYAACRGSAVGPGGDLYFSFVATVESGTHTATIRSGDGGATWDAPTLIPNGPSESSGGVYYGGAIAVSPVTGSVFVARPGEQPLLFRSTDRGATYGAVSVPAIPTTCAACTDVVRTLVSANAPGDIGIQIELGDLDEVSDQAFYPAPLTKEIWLAVSRDEGMTWLDPVKVATVDAESSWIDPRTFAPMPAAPAAQIGGVLRDPLDAQSSFWATAGPLQRADHLVNGGDYTGMTVSGDDFVVMWLAHYNGIPQIWSSRVTVQ